MNLWIRSQDKLILQKIIDGLYIVYKKDTGTIKLKD